MSKLEALYNQGAEIGNKILDSNEKNDSFRKEIENIIKKLNEISSEESKKKAQRLEKLLKRNSNLELVFELAKNYGNIHNIDTTANGNDTTKNSADLSNYQEVEKALTDEEILKKAESYKFEIKSANKELKKALKSIDFYANEEEKNEVKKAGKKLKELMNNFFMSFYSSEQKVIFQDKEWDEIFKEYTELSLGLKDDYEDASIIFNEQDKDLATEVLVARIDFLPNDCDPQDVFNIMGQFHSALDTNLFISDKKEENYKILTKKLSESALKKLSSISNNDEASKALLDFARKVSNMDSFSSKGHSYDFDNRFIDMEIARKAIVLATEKNNKSTEKKGTLFERVSERQSYKDEKLENINKESEIANFRHLASTYNDINNFFDILSIEAQEFNKNDINDFTLGIIVRINDKFEEEDFSGDLTRENIEYKLKLAAAEAREEAIANIDLESWGGLSSIDGEDLVKEGIIDEHEKDLLNTYTDLVGVGMLDFAEDNKDEARKIAGGVASGIILAPAIGALGAVTLGGGALAAGTTLAAQAVILSASTTAIYGEGFDSVGDFSTKFLTDVGVNIVTFGGALSIAKYAPIQEMSTVMKTALSGGIFSGGMLAESARQAYLYEDRGSLMENIMNQGVVQGALSLIVFAASRGTARMTARGESIKLENSSKLSYPVDLIKKSLKIIQEGFKGDKAKDSSVFKGDSLEVKQGNINHELGIDIELKTAINGKGTEAEYITKGLKAEDATFARNKETGEIIVVGDGKIKGVINENGIVKRDAKTISNIAKNFEGSKWDELIMSNGKLKFELNNALKFNIYKEKGVDGNKIKVPYITDKISAEDAIFKKNNLTGEITIFSKEGNLIGKVDKLGNILTDKETIKEINKTIRLKQTFDKEIKTSKGNKSEVEIIKNGSETTLSAKNEKGNTTVIKTEQIKDCPLVLFDKKTGNFTAYHKNTKDKITFDHNGNVIKSNIRFGKLNRLLKQENIKEVKAISNSRETIYTTSEGKEIALKGYNASKDSPEGLKEVFNTKTNRIELYDDKGNLKYYIGEKGSGSYELTNATPSIVIEKVLGRGNKNLSYKDQYEKDGKTYFMFYDNKTDKTSLYNDKGNIVGFLENGEFKIAKLAKGKEIAKDSKNLLTNEKLVENIQKLSDKISKWDENKLKDILKGKDGFIKNYILNLPKKLVTHSINTPNRTILKPLIEGNKAWGNGNSIDGLKTTLRESLRGIKESTGKGEISIYLLFAVVTRINDFNNDNPNDDLTAIINQVLMEEGWSGIAIEGAQEVITPALFGALITTIYELIDDDSIEK